MAATSGSRAVLITILMVFASVASTMEARKLLSNKENVNQHHQARRGDNDNNNNIVPLSNLQDSLILASLPKGAVPSSTPSHKGHGLINTEQLSRHLAELDRILRSVPSPGAGN